MPGKKKTENSGGGWLVATSDGKARNEVEHIFFTLIEKASFHHLSVEKNLKTHCHSPPHRSYSRQSLLIFSPRHLLLHLPLPLLLPIFHYFVESFLLLLRASFITQKFITNRTSNMYSSIVYEIVIYLCYEKNHGPLLPWQLNSQSNWF